MSARSRNLLYLLPVAIPGFLLVSCSSGPRPPQPGTPAFFWAAAMETYARGDYLKANDNLAQLTRTENEFSRRAEPWQLVVSSGLSQAYMDLADIYESGARMNRANPMPFRKQVSLLRGYASNATLQFTEVFHQFQNANKDSEIQLVFGYPGGTTAEPVEAQKIRKGMLVQPSEQESIQRAMFQRGVLLSACRIVGAEEDAPKALEIFKKGEVKAPRADLLMAIANTLVEQAELFGPTKLDQPNRMRILCQEATEALDSVPSSKETKDLSARIQKMLKKARVS